MSWAGRDGPGRARGPGHPASWCSPASGRRSSTPSRRQLKTAIAVGIGLFIALIGLVDAGFVRRTGRRAAVPVAARHRRQPRRLAGPGLRARPAADDRAVRPQGQGRDPDRHLAATVARDHHRGDRRRRTTVGAAARSTRSAGTSTSRTGRTRSSARPDFSLLGDFTLFGGVRAGRRRGRRCCSSSRCCWPTSSTPWAR